MSYTVGPADNAYISTAPAIIRENDRAIINDQIVNAGQLNGYTAGNGNGQIPVSNGTLCTNLNAERLGGQTISYFATSNHTHATVTTSVAGFMSATDKSKLDTIASGAQVNQNAFANIVVGSSTIQADNATDSLTLIAGTNISLTADTTNDTVTINSTYTYTHPASHAASMITEDSTHRFVTDTEKSTWNAKQAALGYTAENTANKGASNGYAGLDASGKLSSAVIPLSPISFIMVRPNENDASGVFIFESNKTITQVRVICTSQAGVASAPTASTGIIVYKNGSSIASFSFSTATTTYDISPDVAVSAADQVYVKFNGSTNGLVNVTIQLTVVGR